MSTIIYTCPKCGADLITESLDIYPPIIYSKCTQCDWRSDKKQEDVIRVPYPEFLPMYQGKPFINEACVNCSNHPSNGGSGICNCTLCTPKIT